MSRGPSRSSPDRAQLALQPAQLVAVSGGEPGQARLALDAEDEAHGTHPPARCRAVAVVSTTRPASTSLAARDDINTAIEDVLGARVPARLVFDLAR